mmetsp:Transcript_83305/g.150260  ORF Transcript_83305/g.150260 Transcript_83305/m.150260 type:complete len:838 (+) Transcript_83305:536-3049(+)
MGDFKCEEKYLMLPAFGEAEMNWPNGLRVFLYIVGLFWLFLGVAVISDVFMNGIERITSQKKRVYNKSTGRTVTVVVWNGTIANLTLMALGSSAPEILLSIIEILTNDMYIGDLGAGTIIGSAAFNLLIISAVCVCALPDGEVRYIKEVPVYAITASSSVMAYLWLMFILMVTSPDICEIWEGLLTFLFFPLMLVLAFLADKGYFSGGGRNEVEAAQFTSAIPTDVTKEELAQIEQNIREEHNNKITDEQLMKIMQERYLGKPSRAYYRHAAMTNIVGGKSAVCDMVSKSSPPGVVAPIEHTHDELLTVEKKMEFGFESTRYAFLESCKNVKIGVSRHGIIDQAAQIRVKTYEGTAKEGSDYEPIDVVLEFEAGEVDKFVTIKFVDDVAYEEDEEFYIELSEPQLLSEGGPVAVTLVLMPEHKRTTVVIVDDDDPGKLCFQQEMVEIEESSEDKTVQVIVERKCGATGTVSCSFHTEDLSAIAGYDYVSAKGDLEFGDSIQKQAITITIKPKGRYEKTSGFNVYLTDPSGGARFDPTTDGGSDKCICHVLIKAAESQRQALDKLASKMNWSKYALGYSNWKDQFKAAIFLQGEAEDGEEPETPSKMEYAIHFASLPWKVLFAIVPPVDYCNGWACFVGALFFIAIVTALVGDMANLVGCTLQINPEITAMTFVALGTSLPDTFASKTAAAVDPHADASIGNITGSNSVNVFLGLGVPWTIAAFYWQCQKPEGEAYMQWTQTFAPGGKYESIADSVGNFVGTGGSPVFVVPSGTLWFNLLVFSANAAFAIHHLYMRRRKLGGELGGPKKYQYATAVFLCTQWLIYIALSSMWATMNAA